MNTPKEQAELTQAKLDGVEIEISSLNGISNKWHPRCMKNCRSCGI